jgi:DNA-directed RNA polymerase, mitochondrial
MELNEKGKDYFYIYGANCYNINNLSKKSFKDRIEWVNLNYDKIVNLDKDFILKAKNLLLFTSFCLNMREIHHNPRYKIHMPIFLDATCSGIQHLAALIKDLNSGIKVNLKPQTVKDKVEDIYSELIDPINNAIKKHGENNLAYSEFKKIKLNRSHLKLPIMTKLYNVSVMGIADQLRNSFEKIKVENNLYYFLVPTEDGFTKISYLEIYTLAEIINKQIFNSLPYLEEVYKYLKEIVKLCLKCNIPLTWFTPSGLKITQFYALSKQNKISISFKNKTKSVVLRSVTDKVDSKKQVNSIIPNIIHSLDASHLINIINTGLQNVELPYVLTIHDCFGTHPNNIEQLKNLVILEFVKLYADENFLKKYHDRIKQNLNDNHFQVLKNENGKEYIVIKKTSYIIPELPNFGNLKFEDILKSQYFIT